MRINPLGEFELFLNPAQTTFSSAELAAIDETYNAQTVSPYAYSASPAEFYDTHSFMSATAAITFPFGTRFAVGIFFTPDNEKGSLTWQLTGKAWLHGAGATVYDQTHGFFFFGRKATNNTVVSSKAATSNTLDKWQVLPSNYNRQVTPTGTSVNIEDSINTQLFSLADAGKYVYCFGYAFHNDHGATSLSCRWRVDLAARKFTSMLPVHDPTK